MPKSKKPRKQYRPRKLPDPVKAKIERDSGEEFRRTLLTLANAPSGKGQLNGWGGRKAQQEFNKQYQRKAS